MSFVFVHAADLHLDSPLRASGRVDPVLQPLFSRATFRALERVVDVCLARGAAFLVLAGDLFETKDRSVSARLQLREQLKRLDAAGIRVFVVHGNHDPLSGDTGTFALPGNVKVFGEAWEEVPVRLDGRLACRVQGVSYPFERVEENLAKRFRRQGPELTIGVLHANVGAQRAHANYAPASWEDLAEVRLDYWALGHVHTRQERTLSSGGLAVYAGNTQGRHALEAGPRGCTVVEVEEGHCETSFVPVDSVRWHALSIDLEGIGELGALEREIEARIDEACGSGSDAHAVRLSLEGPSSLHAELSRSENREALEAHLREALRDRTTPVVLEGLTDESEPTLDLEALRAEGGMWAAVMDQAEVPEAGLLFRESGVRQVDEAFRQLGLSPLFDDARRLLGKAARRAVSLLAEDES